MSSDQANKKFYIVVKGRQPGLYPQWFGEDGAEEQIRDRPDALFKGFTSVDEARTWLKEVDAFHLINQLGLDQDKLTGCPQADDPQTAIAAGHVVLFAIGLTSQKTTAGSYGVVMRYKEHTKEFSGGFRATTAIRTEIMACLIAIQALKKPMPVSLYTNSDTIFDALHHAHLQYWADNGWYHTNNKRLENVDLWYQLHRDVSNYNIAVGLTAHPPKDETGQHCFQIAQTVLEQPHLPPDTAYEGDYTRQLSPALSKKKQR